MVKKHSTILKSETYSMVLEQVHEVLQPLLHCQVRVCLMHLGAQLLLSHGFHISLLFGYYEWGGIISVFVTAYSNEREDGPAPFQI